MAEAIVSLIFEQLASILSEKIAGEVRLIGSAEEDVENIRSNFLEIKAVINDAKKRQLKEGAVRDWLYYLKRTSYDIEDVLDEWNTATRKLQMKRVENAAQPKRTVCSFISPSCFCSPKQLIQRHNIATKLKNLNKKLDNIAWQKDMFGFGLMEGTGEVELRQSTTCFIDGSKIYGRDHHKNTLVKLLISGSESSTSQGPNQLPIISIVGVGGVGKTTLAKLVFNDNAVNTHFDKKTWVCVSEPFDEIRTARAILESLKGTACNVVELETVCQQIRDSTEGKKFFLVLDDVWTEYPQNWEQLMNSLKRGYKGSRILVTTRNKNVANILGSTEIISMGLLSNNDCWSIFSQLAFFERSDEEREAVEHVGRRIVGKCKGLPLAVKTLGSFLRFKRKIEEWQRVLESELWELEEVEKGLFAPLLLSYYDLPPALEKMLFILCYIFKRLQVRKRFVDQNVDGSRLS